MGCNVDSNENGLVASSPEAINTTRPTATITSTLAIETLPAFTPDSENSAPEEIARATATAIPTVTATPTPTPSLTPPPVPLPTAVFIECQATSPLPDKAFPTQLDMTGSHNQRVAISYPYLYLAAEQYIGVFDISAPDKPIFLGFWEFPHWPNISTLQVNSGVIYFTTGTTLVTLNLSPECLFETIGTTDLSLQAYQLQIEDNHLYLGGLLPGTERRQISIFSIDGPGKLEESSTVDFGDEPARWSVFDGTIYSLGDTFTLIDVSDPTNPQTRESNLELDPEILRYSPSEFFEDRLYLLWEGHYLTIISNLQDEAPVVKRDSQQRIIGGDLSNFVYQVSENYIFLGDSLCDISCRSVVTIFNSENGQELSRYGLPDDHYPIHSYYEISQDIIYAFSDEFLLVMDISDIANPKIIAEVPLIT
jgi:hypothetical protein